MVQKISCSALMLAFAAVSQLAQAFVDPPTLSPTNPTSGQTVSVNIRFGVCDVIGVIREGYPKITQTGDAVRILLVSNVPNSGFCNFPILTGVFSIGAYSAGSYTVQVDRIYSVADGDAVENLAGLSLIVVDAIEPSLLPTTGTLSLFILAVIIIFIATAMLRYQKVDRNRNRT